MLITTHNDWSFADTIRNNLILAYDHEAYGDARPTSIVDFFDTNKFPGKRAIRNDPTVIMERALMADGVNRDDVYSTLETPWGIN